MRRPGWRPLFATAGLWLLAVVPASAQAPAKKPPSAAFLQGTHAFRRILYDTGKDLSKNGFKALETFNDLNDDPRHTLLIMFGKADRLTEIPGGLESFVGRGGAFFLATDKPLPADAAGPLAHTAGVAVSGQTVVCRLGDANCYRDLDYCPFLWPEPEGSPELFRNVHPESGRASTVATNAPSYLVPRPGARTLRTLASLPRLCQPEGTGTIYDMPLLFGVGGDLGGQGGRILILADHSIFINDMIMQTDNGNLDFSYNCIKWMTGGPEPRTRILFVEDDNINSTFDVPLKEMPDELADRLLDFLGAVLEKKGREAGPFLERKAQQFDEDLVRWCYENDVTPFGLLLVLLAVFAVLYGCWKVGWKARYRADLQGPLLAMALHRVAPTETVVEQRRMAQIRGDNGWEQARDLARQWLGDAPAGATPPRIVVRGGWLQCWSLAGRFRRMWRLAFGPPVRVRLSQWPRLLREVEALKAAFADGTIQFK